MYIYIYINFVNYSRLDAQTLKFRLYSSTNNLFCLIVVQYSSRNNLFSLSLCLSVSLSTFFRHGTARLHLYLFAVSDRLKIATGPSTGVARVTHTDQFFPRHGTAECFHLRKAKNLGTGAKPAPFTLSELAVPCRKTAAPVPKY